jgi:hypothetical protein
LIRAVLFDIGGPIDLENRLEAALDAGIRAGLQREGFEISEDAWQAGNAKPSRPSRPTSTAPSSGS